MPFGRRVKTRPREIRIAQLAMRPVSSWFSGQLSGYVQYPKCGGWGGSGKGCLMGFPFAAAETDKEQLVSIPFPGVSSNLFQKLNIVCAALPVGQDGRGGGFVCCWSPRFGRRMAALTRAISGVSWSAALRLLGGAEERRSSSNAVSPSADGTGPEGRAEGGAEGLGAGEVKPKANQTTSCHLHVGVHWVRLWHQLSSGAQFSRAKDSPFFSCHLG